MKGQIPIHLTIEINLKVLNVYAMYVMLFIVHVLKEFPSSTLFSECYDEIGISNKASRSTCSGPKTCSIQQSLICSNDSMEIYFGDDQLMSNSASNETTHNSNHLPCSSTIMEKILIGHAVFWHSCL